MPSSLWLFVVALIPILCQASPINRQVGLSDNVFMTTQNGTDGLEQRVCSIDAVTYRDGETIPTSSPCEHCVCRPPGFACTITSCEYRPGCKAFRRSDQCCPEYQCECEKDGKIYQNGEKIMDNNNPCEVCYCQGGEIICAVIDCYWRNDCPPRYIDNRCCPMYDHCPPPSAAQGPIRHRLPSLTSPISWHNASTQAPPQTTQTPLVELVSSESTTVSTTTTTTSTTTSTTTTEQPQNEVETDENALSDVAVPHEEVVPTEQVVTSVPVEQPSEVPIQTSSEAPPSEAPQSEIEMDQALNVSPQQDEPSTEAAVSEVPSTDAPVIAEVHVNDEAPANDEPATQAPATETPSSDDLDHPAPLHDGVEEEGVPTIEPTTVSEAVISSTVIDSTTLFIAPALVFTISPTTPLQTLITSEATVLSQFHDHGGEHFTTESDVQQQYDEPQPTTSSPLIAEIYPDSPSESVAATERLADGVTDKSVQETNELEEVLFDHHIQDDETQVATEAATVQDDEVPTATERNLLWPGEIQERGEEVAVTTEQPSQDEVATTLPPIQQDEEIIAHDEVQQDDEGSIPIEATTEASNDDVEHDEVQHDDEAIEVTTTQAANDEPAPPEPVTTESPVANEVQDELNHDDAAGEATTIAALILDNEISQNDDPTTVASADDDIQADEGSVADSHEVTTAASDSILDSEPVTQSDNDITSPVHDEVVASLDEEVEQATTVGSVVQNDDVAVTTQASVEAVNDEPTEGIHADEPSETEAPVEKAEVEVEDEIASPTEAPLVQHDVSVKHHQENENDIFDIILDDEVIPSQPETLNQVKENHNVDEVVHEQNNIASEKEVEENEYELSHGVRNTDSDTVEIVNFSAAEQGEEATTQPPHSEESQDIQNDAVASDDDDDDVQPGEVTTLPSDIAHDEPSTVSSEQLFNDDVTEGAGVTEPVASDAVMDDEPEATPLSDDVDVTTSGYVQDDDVLRHHLGVPHDDDNATTISPEFETISSDDVVSNDDSVTNQYEDHIAEHTTSFPLNKVQKVSELLGESSDDLPASLEVGNKFRLEVDVFQGSLENLSSEKQVESGDIGTEPPARKQEEFDDIPQTTSASRDDLPVFADSAIETTQQPSRLRTENLEASTVRIVYDSASGDEVTEGSGSVQQDEPVTTQQYSRSDLMDGVEGSGTSSPLVQADDTLDLVEGSGSAPTFDDESAPTTTSLPLALNDGVDEHANEIVETEAVTNSYAFRMDLLSSVEEEESDNSQPIASTVPPQFSEIQSDSVDASTQFPEVILQDDTTIRADSEDVVQQDEVVVATTEAVSRLRSDLEITTELVGSSAAVREDLPEQSTVLPENAQDDFVEVSTFSPSGFAAAFRDDIDSVTGAEIQNDEVAAASTSHSVGEELLQNDNGGTERSLLLVEESTVHQVEQVAERDEAQTPSFDEKVTVPSGRSDLEEIQSTVFADEPEATTSGSAGERLRSETILVEPQTERLQDSTDTESAVNDEVVATTVGSSSLEEKNQTESSVSRRRQEIVLPEKGMPKIQPISPDLSRSNPHELRFDLQLPPEDNSWLSRAVNQFRRLSGFGTQSSNNDPKANVGSTRPKIPSRRFLLF